MENKSKSKLKLFGMNKVFAFIRPDLGTFIVMLATAAIVSAFSAIWPLFQKYAIDTFIAGGTTEGMPLFIAAYLGCILVYGVLQYFSMNCTMKVEMYTLRNMRRAAFNHLQTLSVAYYNQHGVGALHSRVMSDTGSISYTVAWNLFDLVWSLAYTVVVTVIMFSLNYIMALCVVAIVPIAAAFSIYFNRRFTTLNRESREINSMLTADYNDGITGVETSKTLTIEKRLDDKFIGHAEKMRRKQTLLGHHRALFRALVSFAASVSLAVVLWLGGGFTAEGIILLGTLTVFMSYAQNLSEEISSLVMTFSQFVYVKVNVERLDTLLNTESDVKDTPEVEEKYGDCFNFKTQNWEPLHGDIEFKDVTFKYPDGDEYVLEHFNLKVKQGTTVAIVGETGAGKSTLVNLICRFYEPTSGAVLIDGKDARERSVGWLHSNIGYVLQTPHLFSGTVRENMLYGKPDATDVEIMEAIKSVNAERIIERMDMGLDAPIGEGGNNLSTGEKQLLSFARAILADPAIFILDEATSSVDTITENLIQQAIDKLMQGRTSFIIAHRLSTIRSADIILFVHDGKIIERGTHEQLLKAKGAYYNLYIQQFREEGFNSVFEYNQA